MRLRSLAAAALLAGAAAVGSPGCTSAEPSPQLQGQLKLTLLHTSDIHSRLFPYDLRIGPIDSKLGLGANGEIARVGGVARISHLLGRERARADRVLHLDGGDCFQGAPVFNFFNGEAEIRALSEMGTDAMLIANHEFDKGPLNLGIQLQNWATFPILTANYKFEAADNPGSAALSRVAQPFTTFNLDGLKVAAIGMGNLSSLSSLFEQPNRLGITPLNTIDIAQFYIDLLRPLVDVIVFMTHLGLEVDERMIEGTSGIDIVLGGHNHIVLQPPKVTEDCQKVDADGRHYIDVLSPKDQEAGSPPAFTRRRCEPRKVVLAHSGAFAKYIGRLDAVLSNKREDVGETYDPLNGYELISHDYNLIPITEEVPEDPHVRNLLTPYKRGLDALTNLELLVGYAPDGASRVAPAGGDSALGNLVATAMWLRQGIQTDFALTNTQGIRTDMVPGPVSLEQFYNIFPFDNAITKMQLSGIEVQRMFDFTARRAASRACASQVQIAGSRIVINCTGCDRSDLTVPCATSDDCPTSGKCDKGTHRCLPQPCAEAIYIGRDEAKTCTSATEATDCGPGVRRCDITRLDAQSLGRCSIPINPISSYELATSDYLAGGGSGFSILKANTTQVNTRVQQRDALIDYLRQGRPCGYSKENKTEDGLKACVNDTECQVGFVCACGANSAPTTAGTCQTTADCTRDEGRCVLRQCRDDVAVFQRKTCDTGRTEGARADCETTIAPCEIAGETCKFLACVDQSVGNLADGRQIMVGR